MQIHGSLCIWLSLFVVVVVVVAFGSPLSRLPYWLIFD